MSTVTYVGSQYYLKETNDDGTIIIGNGSSNYVMKQYNEYLGQDENGRYYNYTGEKYWDYPKQKVNCQSSYPVYDSDGNWIEQTYTYWDCKRLV